MSSVWRAVSIRSNRSSPPRTPSLGSTKKQTVWEEQAKRLSWGERWEKPLYWAPPFAQWFVGMGAGSDAIEGTVGWAGDRVLRRAMSWRPNSACSQAPHPHFRPQSPLSSGMNPPWGRQIWKPTEISHGTSSLARSKKSRTPMASIESDGKGQVDVPWGVDQSLTWLGSGGVDDPSPLRTRLARAVS
jgi:hypothetical protein